MKRHAVLITDAEPSQEAQLRSRQIRYATMMGIRIVALIALVILAAADAPLPWLWVPLCATGMLLLPWMAVLIANDRPPKREHTLRGKIARRHAQVADADGGTQIAGTPHGSRVVDAEDTGSSAPGPPS